MVKTITLGSCVSVQGLLVRTLNNGEIVIKVGKRLYTGLPISA